MAEQLSLKGRPETGKSAAVILLWVSGDGHRGISPSGAGRSAFSRRLQVPAELPMPPLSTCQLAHVSPSRSANHPVSGSPFEPGALWSTEPLGLQLLAPCPRVNLSTGQLIQKSLLHFCTGAPLRFAPLHITPFLSANRQYLGAYALRRTGSS